MPRTLLVEDSKEFQLIVRSALEGVSELTVAGSAAEAIESLRKQTFDLIILDIGLPDKSGYELCASFRAGRETQNVPIFILTGRGDLSDKLTGFSLGADDFIVKPFEVLEFQARVSSRLKRQQSIKQTKSQLEYKGLSLNLATHEIRMQLNGGPATNVSLTPHEFRLLAALLGQPGVVLSREQLLNTVWGTNTFVDDRTVDKHISSLRKKLGPNGSYIKTASGFGYKVSEDS